MDWLDTVLASATPALAVMSVLAMVIPTGRGRGVWRGIGLAWLSAFVIGLGIAVTHLDSWTLACRFDILPGGRYIPSGTPCTGLTALPIWMSELPALSGLAILLAWCLRNIRPWRAGARVGAALLALTAAILGVGQLNANLGLLLFVVVVAAIYALPRLQRPRPSARPT